ncbi:MAG: hypothetical protein PWP71_2461 [Clostridia bacterium]|nr:hypothetical protein [Clostridia bacterium]
MIGEKIRQAREAKGLKQTELARMAELANSTICDIEKGRLEPSLKSLNKISKALELTITFFISNDYENNVKKNNQKTKAV